ncbi:hypothetical protein A6R68_16764 [Neotoma lepida]|uniref:Uncharacterized protein n=1 Tax=Neotoma lepida TaxID=56216 RepID=A0A1A6HFQ5_NEOLE|nr:hypothetical protein A6R68_16764 [Neotoma lepida]
MELTPEEHWERGLHIDKISPPESTDMMHTPVTAAWLALLVFEHTISIRITTGEGIRGGGCAADDRGQVYLIIGLLGRFPEMQKPAIIVRVSMEPEMRLLAPIRIEMYGINKKIQLLEALEGSVKLQDVDKHNDT